ncbi:hypothetical protein OIU76_025542 [Salix suchowensis]|uniref:Uncharacterized protein n=1 Tax=Salix udensis TaxID=889485 RepID=A0AAD6K7K8_9ROSI|nr:hypothetical protein OIU76_025542 [Salix suchowensis]KAJ6417217.1 hypothetical protein OIU84_003013 [Salix udensis]
MASKLLLIIVSVFDIIAFGLAVAAEQRRSTVSKYIFIVPSSIFLVNLLLVMCTKSRHSSVVSVVPGFLDNTEVRFC